MVKKIIMEWKDGDSGVFLDGTKFRMSGVNSPEKNDAGYGLATRRARQMLDTGDVVEVETVGKDTYKRDIVKMKKRGIDINKALEFKNRLFGGK